MKKFILVSLILLLGWQPLIGIAADSPQTVVETTSERMLDALRENRATLQKDPRQIYDLVNEIVLPHFDFTVMSRWVLGKYWRQATAEQRSRFVEEFRTLLVRTYSQALLEYSNETIKFLPMPQLAPEAKDVTVRSEFHPQTGAPIPVNYSLHLFEGEWKIYDVTVDGVSLVTNYRSTFADQIRADGIEAVINSLAERNRE
ncbi:MAG: ABC transporter substrate-binding protein [Candidatus Competibacteraceae bacterium]|jgi:phospholipid transport system substrate-binding protein|nr:ABC transporter substrate-binding protein [Candidatus Competibacteraceae bacterium]